MPLVRRIARPLLASVYVYGGLDAFRHPATKVPAADSLVADLPAKLPGLSNTEQLVKVDGAAKVLGGVALGLGKFPRLASLGLIASLIPTTLAGHPFWKEQDPAKRKMQQLQFIKNAAILGGTLLAAVDTEGKPSVGWRARRAARNLRDDTVGRAHSLGGTVHDATSSLGDKASALSDKASSLSDKALDLLPTS